MHLTGYANSTGFAMEKSARGGLLFSRERGTYLKETTMPKSRV